MKSYQNIIYVFMNLLFLGSVLCSSVQAMEGKEDLDAVRERYRPYSKSRSHSQISEDKVMEGLKELGVDTSFLRPFTCPSSWPGLMTEIEARKRLEELGVDPDPDLISSRFSPLKCCSVGFLETVAGITKGYYAWTYSTTTQWIMEYVGKELYGDDTFIRAYHTLNKELRDLKVFQEDSGRKSIIKSLARLEYWGDNVERFINTVKRLVIISARDGVCYPLNDGILVEAVGNIPNKSWEDHEKFIAACKDVCSKRLDKREAILELSKTWSKKSSD